MVARKLAVLAGLLLPLAAPTQDRSENAARPFDTAEASARAAHRLLKAQGSDGSWGADSIFGRDTNIRSSITLFCARALEAAASDDDRARKAVARAREFVLAHANDRPVRPSYDMYDFSFYSGAYGLQYFAPIARAEPRYSGEVERLLRTVLACQRRNGGFSYTWRSRYEDTFEGFASAVVLLALLEARQSGVAVPQDAVDRCLDSIERSRLPEGYFGYHIESGRARGSFSGNGRLAREGSLVRTVVSEYALVRAGRGRRDHLKRAVDDFFRHRGELEKVRKRDERTHQGEFDNAPYYFWFGHYYAALALEELDAETRVRGREALLGILQELREEDGGWFDSKIVGRAYGTALGLLLLRRVAGPEF